MPAADNHVIVRFGSIVPGDVQGVVMMAMEKHLRRLGYPCEVFKDTMADDSRLRREMTPEERNRL